MTNIAEVKRMVVSGRTRMTPSEVFVETLVFPAAGIRFLPTVHEQGAAHMADGFSRLRPPRRVHRAERAWTIVELMCTRELGDSFRRDALKKPHRLFDKYRACR